MRLYAPICFLLLLDLAACGGSMSYDAVAWDSGAPSPAEAESYLTVATNDRSAPSDDYRNTPAPQSDPEQTAQAEPSKPSDSVDPVSPPSEPVQQSSPVRRLVIYTAQLSMAVLDIDEAVAKASASGEQLGGWVQASSTTSLVVRVPADKFRDFIEVLHSLGTVLSENIVGQDVTEEFLDLEIRLRNALALRDRFEALLAKANTVADTLAIENELARITTEIERMKGRLRYLQQQLAFSTVTLNFAQPQGSQQTRIRLPFNWLQALGLHGLYQVEYR